jgi:hypothetical protein
MIHTLEEVAIEKSSLPNAGLTISDAVWIGTAVLQYSNANKELSFEPDIIWATVFMFKLTQGDEKSIRQHILQHCVANKKPHSNRSCMLFATEGRQRRLFRDGDMRDPGREGAPTHPAWAKVPAQFSYLKDWYETVWNVRLGSIEEDPLLALAGVGRGIWSEGADAHVASLRDGWESRP